MADITQRQQWRQTKRLRQYWGQTITKFARYNKPTSESGYEKEVAKEIRRLLGVARTIYPRRHLTGVSYQIHPDLWVDGRSIACLLYTSPSPRD